MIERLDLRTAHGKHFELDEPGKFRLQVSPRIYHVPDDPAKWSRGEPVVWEDPDHGFDTVDNSFRLRKSWCRLDVPLDSVGYRYRSRLTGGTLDVRLVRLDGQPVVDETLPTPRIDGNDVWWDNVVPELDIYVKIRPGRVELFKRLRGTLSPRRFRWRITESLPSVTPMNVETAGYDNADRAEPSRIGTGLGRRRRAIQMDHVIGPDDLTTLPGFRIFTVDERWTGKTIALDAQRVPSLSDDVEYPVLIDQDITETIVADADDGHQETYPANEWVNSVGGNHSIYSQGGYFNFPGYRFQGVAIPQGSTIDAATLTLTVETGGGGTGAGGVLYGHDIDTATAWATGAGPVEMVRTTASVAFTPWGTGASGVRAHTVTSIVQEIVNRGGWVSGNHMAFGVQGTLTPSGGYSEISDLAGGAGGIAVLTVDYTVGGAVFMAARRRPVLQAVNQASTF